MHTESKAAAPATRCNCHQCLARIEVLDVLEALQIDAARNRNHIALLTAENTRLQAEALRLAKQLDHEIQARAALSDARLARMADPPAIDDETGRSAWVGVLICGVCVITGAVWQAWMGRVAP